MNKVFARFYTFFVVSLSWCSAHAESHPNFDIILGGDAFYTSGLVHQNTDAGARNLEFMNRFRLTVTPTALADNGVTYGARLRVRASLSSGIIDGDQAYLFARGVFGVVEAGTQLNPNMYYHVIAPSNFGTGGFDGDWAIGNEGWIQNQLTFLEPYFGGGYTITTFVKSANRLDYISPRLFSDGDPQHGLLATVSYAPANRDVFTGVDRTMLNTDPGNNRPYGYGRTKAFSNCLGGGGGLGCDYHDIDELSLREDETIGGVTVSGGLARIAGTTGRTNFGTLQSFYDLSAWQAGVQLGFGGVLVGGSFADAGRSAYPRQSAATGRLYEDDQYTWTAGVSYATGPVSVGFNYEFGHDAGDLTAPGARTAALYAVGIGYRLAPGLSMALETMRSTTHTETGFVSDPLGFNRTFSGNANMFLWKTQVMF